MYSTTQKESLIPYQKTKCACVKMTKFKILQLKFHENFFQGYTLMIKQSIKIMDVKKVCV